MWFGRSTTPTRTSSATASSSIARVTRAGSTPHARTRCSPSSELDWDTASLPEGKYRIRVDASDELANSPGDSTRFTLESPLVLVDNTPPVFKSIAMQGHRLRAEVVDGLGPITRIEVTADGRNDWRPLAPNDGILDTADETIDFDLTPLMASAVGGPHVVAVRAFDAAGNAVVRDVQSP